MKKVIFAIFFNSSVFVVLLIGIQNSSSKSKVNLLLNETVKLPLSFIIGTSFITGSIFGSLLPTINFNKKI
jgi:uncharacterized integral membrane protein